MNVINAYGRNNKELIIIKKKAGKIDLTEIKE